MGCVSADDANFLPAGKKVGRHYMSGVAACSKDDVHSFTSMPGLDALGFVLDSGTRWGNYPDWLKRPQVATCRPLSPLVACRSGSVCCFLLFRHADPRCRQTGRSQSCNARELCSMERCRYPWQL